MSHNALNCLTFTNKGDRELNEDYYDEITLEAGRCFIMADGYGAHGAGDLAAKLFCSSFLTEIEAYPINGLASESELILNHHIEHAKEKMCEELKRVGYPEARATCAIVWVNPHKMLTAHVGDTRIYRLSAQGAIWHTRDHTLAAEKQDGFYASDIARHTLLKSLGTGIPVKATLHILEPLQKEETIVLCTDGFWEHVAPEEWRLLAETSNLEDTFHNIKKRLLSLEANRDNMSAQVIRRLA